ncbi:unnamed protein product [Orchesella dallaii]|uniref:CCHC-type domain-containing protein n=1 Tax=Orchesella dallaii TaxID=48710 RepID=A0ABP1QB26_9HEXA
MSDSPNEDRADGRRELTPPPLQPHELARGRYGYEHIRCRCCGKIFRRRFLRQCLGCGEFGHIGRNCPNANKIPLNKQNSNPGNPPSGGAAN